MMTIESRNVTSKSELKEGAVLGVKPHGNPTVLAVAESSTPAICTCRCQPGRLTAMRNPLSEMKLHKSRIKGKEFSGY